MIHTDLKGLAAALGEADSFVLTTHVNPDGDGIGSVLALKLLLETMGKSRVVCAMDGTVPEPYRWLVGADAFEDGRTANLSADVSVLLDTACIDRTGETGRRLDPTAQLLVIDHHREPNPDGARGFIDPTYAAVGEIIVELFDAVGVPLTRAAAECTYVAQITDTGNYRYGNTNPRSHRIAAALLDTDIDVETVTDRVFSTMPVPKFELLRRVLDAMCVGEEGSVAWSQVTREDRDATGATFEHFDGFVNYARNIEGVKVGLLFTEVDAATTKLSVRSRGAINCAEIASQFGGGGHAGAAGATLAMPLAEARDAVLAHVHAGLIGDATP